MRIEVLIRVNKQDKREVVEATSFEQALEKMEEKYINCHVMTMRKVK